jgi:hypothetical protein
MAGMRIDESGGYSRTSDEMMKSKTHIKTVSSAEGAGGIMDYSDTNEKIVRDQKAGDGKIRSKPMKPGYRY